MYLKLKFLIIIALYCPLIQPTRAQCSFKITRDKSVRPILLRDTDYFTSLVSEDEEIIHLNYSEEIKGFCQMGFEIDPNSYKEAELYCNGNYVRLRTSYDYYDLGSRDLKCKPVIEKNPQLCTVNLSPQKLNRPKVFKIIGTKNVQMSSEINSFHLYNEQKATVRCATKFKNPKQLTTELNLVCVYGQIIALHIPFSSSYGIFECESLEWNLYESSVGFKWCPPSVTSYILARPAHHSHNGYEYLGGICYDLEKMSLKSLFYTVGPKSLKNLSPKILTTYKPSIVISDISENYISKKTFIYDNPQIENWMKYSNYKTLSIVQNHWLSMNILMDIEQLLEIDWWLNLQLGNWRFYEAALAKHIALNSKQYEILAGTSGVVAAPIRKETCDKNFTLTPIEDTDNNKIPLYIWNYLKSANKSSEDVVIIGVNSPFYDFYDENELVFCKDICHQVPWLDNVYATFRYKLLGVIFCCTVDEVIASQRLDGFTIPTQLLPLPPPINYFIPMAMETSTTVTEDTTPQEEIIESEREYDEYVSHY